MKNFRSKAIRAAFLKWRALATFALAGIFIAFIAPGNAKGETLADALSWAYSGNDELKAQRAELKAGAENITQVTAAVLPKVNLSAALSSTGSNRNAIGVVDGWRDTDNLSANIGASLLLYDFGRTAQAEGSARANLKAATHRLLSNEQQIFLSTIRAYVDVLRDRQLVQMATSNIGVFENQLASAKIAFDAGSVTLIDVSAAEAALAGARASLSQAEAALSVSEEGFRKLTKKYPGALEPVSTPPSLPGTLEDALARGQRNSPLIHAAMESERAARFDLRRAELGRMPSVNISAGVGKSNADRDWDDTTLTTNVEIGVNAPLYQGGSIPSMVRQSQELLSARSAETNNARAIVEQNIVNAWNNIANTTKVYEASQETVAARRLAYDGAELQYDVGVITLGEKLEREQALISARTDSLSAGYERQFAGFQLFSAMGALDINTLGLNIRRINPVPAGTTSKNGDGEVFRVDQLIDRWLRPE